MNKANKAQKSTYSDSINVEDFLKKFARNWQVQMVQFLQDQYQYLSLKYQYKYPVLQSC